MIYFNIQFFKHTKITLSQLDLNTVGINMIFSDAKRFSFDILLLTNSVCPDFWNFILEMTISETSAFIKLSKSLTLLLVRTGITKWAKYVNVENMHQIHVEQFSFLTT